MSVGGRGHRPGLPDRAALIEKILSLDNVFVIAAIFSAFAIPARYQHRVLMLGINGTLIMHTAFAIAGVTLLEAFHPVSYRPRKAPFRRCPPQPGR
ncbi:MAG: TerC family protein [Streptosporangiaceae bacterium]